jgi:hypothetical protein
MEEERKHPRRQRVRKPTRLLSASSTASVDQSVTFLCTVLSVASLHYLDELTAARELKLAQWIRTVFNQHEQRIIRDAISEHWIKTKHYHPDAVQDLWNHV